MTSSRSKASISSRWLVLAVLLCTLGVAHAERRRVVVLPFEGEKAEKFHEAVVKIIKKSHSVIPVDKYTSTADDLSASKVNEKNVKKVSKKLKLDGVVTGTVEKRRDQYILRIKVRAGKTGDFVGNDIKTTAEGPRLDGSAARDLKDELVDLISNLASNRGGGSDDEEEDDRPKKADEEDEEEEEVKPKKKPAKVEEEIKPKKKPAKVEEEEEDEEEQEALKTKKGGFNKKKFDEEADQPAKSEEEEEDEDSPLPKSKKRPKGGDEDEDEVASREDGEDGEDGEVTEEADSKKMNAALALSPGNRAVDFVAGLSFNARRMAFKFDPDLENRPPGYKGVPAPGLLLDATIYPLAIGHSNTGMLKNFGLTFMYDKVLLINSKDPMGVKLDTKAARYAVGAVFRYPFNKTATSPVIGAQLRYGRQKFTIGGMADIPNVNYTILDPGVFLKFPVSPKVVLNVDAAFMLITNTGAIQKTDEYGPATVSGFEGELGLDYMVTKALFARAAFRFETIGLTFKGGANKTSNRDADEAQDVAGARDSYFGGIATIGYLY